MCEKWSSTRRHHLELCGHPWAALCTFDATLVSLIRGFQYIAVGNEYSANFGNACVYQGEPINHQVRYALCYRTSFPEHNGERAMTRRSPPSPPQYDKSLAFGAAAHAYIRTYIANDVWYWSPLSALWELQVGAYFVACCRSFLPVFVSCNSLQEGNDDERWCARCAKCLFVVLLLSAFLPPADVSSLTSGRNPLDDPELWHLMEALLATSGRTKPLDCVGTPEEVAWAVERACKIYQRASEDLPVLLRKGISVLEQQHPGPVKRLPAVSRRDHCFPEWFAPLSIAVSDHSPVHDEVEKALT